MITSILIPVVILSNNLTDNSEAYYSEYVNPSIKKQVQTNLLRIENFFENSKSEIEMYANIIELNDDRDYIFRLLDQFLEQNPIFTNAYYSNKSGENYLDSYKVPAVDGRKRYWYKEAQKTDDFVMLEPHIDALTNEWVVTLSTPVHRNGIFYGVLGVDVLVSDIVTNIAKKIDSSNEKYIILNDLKQIIFCDESIADEDEVSNLIDNDNNSNYVIEKYNMDRLKMDIFIIYSSDNYFSNMKSIGKQMAILYIFIVSITVVFGFTGAKRMSLPLSNFKNRIRHLNSPLKNYDYRYETLEWDSEFFELFSKFNKFSKMIELDKEKLSYRVDILSEKNNKLIGKNMDLEGMYKNLKSMDKRVRKSKLKYESILSNIKGMIWILNGDGEIVFVNAILKKYLDYSMDELKGKPISKILESTYSEHNHIVDIICNRDFKKIDIELVTKGGKKIQVEANTTRVFDNNNNIMFIYGVCRDIGKEKELHYNYNVKIQEQNLIMDLTETASMNVSLSQVTEVIFEKFNNIFGWSEGTIKFLNENNEFELIARTKTYSPNISDEPLECKDSCLSYVIGKNEILYANSVEDLPTEEDIYCKIIEDGYSIIFIPVGNKEIGQGVISLTVDKKSVYGKEEMLRSFTSTILIVVERAIVYGKLKKDYIRMIKVLADAGDDKDFSSVGHSNRVASYSRGIAENMYLDDEELIDIEICGLLHDIGKVGISDELLYSDLNYNENKEVIKHTSIGRKMLEGIGLSVNILDGIEFHHKNLDLSGYPYNSYVDSLPLFAKIIQVADSFDNLKVSGLYSTDIEVWKKMNENTGSEFCPQVMRIFKDNIEKGIS